VADGSPDNIVGVVKVKDVLAVLLAGRKVSLAKLMRKAEIVPDQLDAMDALRLLQQSGVAMALVHDEYGHLEGVKIAATADEFIAACEKALDLARNPESGWLAEADLMLSASSWDITQARMAGLIAQCLGVGGGTESALLVAAE